MSSLANGNSVRLMVEGLTASSSSWRQGYDPAHHWWLSTIWASLPLVVLLVAMMGLRLKGHVSAVIALVIGLSISVGIFHMPVHLAFLSTMFGVGYGLFPICWIVVSVIFMYKLTVHANRFNLLEECLVGVTDDSRLQLVLIAFVLGSFFEGAAGFGTPVAVCSAILIGLGFRPLEAAGLTLLANTVPVAFGSLGIPVTALHGITGLDLFTLTCIISALLTPFCLLMPFWLVCAFAGFKAMWEVWPPLLVAGTTFGLTQLFVARVQGPWLVDIIAAIISLAVFLLFLRFWKPKRILDAQRRDITHLKRFTAPDRMHIVRRAATPWILLTLFVVVWGTPQVARLLDKVSTLQFAIAGLDNVVFRMPPIVVKPLPEAAVFTFNWLSATGSGIFFAAIVAAFAMGLRPRAIVRVFWNSIVFTRFTMITIAVLMGLASVSRFCGLDVTLGLAFARSGSLYPFFGTLVGWLGTASTGSDTASNVLFGNLQKFTAQQLGINPYIMVSANSGAGVMGKMMAPQSVVVASTAAGVYGSEGTIMKFVLLHSLAFVCLMGGLVSLVIYCPLMERLILK